MKQGCLSDWIVRVGAFQQFNFLSNLTCKVSAARLRSKTPSEDWAKRSTNFFVRRPREVSYRVFSGGDFGARKKKYMKGLLGFPKPGFYWAKTPVRQFWQSNPNKRPFKRGRFFFSASSWINSVKFQLLQKKQHSTVSMSIYSSDSKDSMPDVVLNKKKEHESPPPSCNGNC